MSDLHPHEENDEADCDDDSHLVAGLGTSPRLTDVPHGARPRRKPGARNCRLSGSGTCRPGGKAQFGEELRHQGLHENAHPRRASTGEPRPHSEAPRRFQRARHLAGPIKQPMSGRKWTAGWRAVLEAERSRTDCILGRDDR